MSICPRLFARPTRHGRKMDLALAHGATSRQGVIGFVDRPQFIVEVPDRAMRGAGKDAAGKSVMTLFTLAMAVVLGKLMHMGLRLVTGPLVA